MKFTTTILILTCLIFEDVCNSFGNNDRCLKMVKIHYGLNGLNVESLGENHKKEVKKRSLQQQQNKLQANGFTCI